MLQSLWNNCHIELMLKIKGHELADMSNWRRRVAQLFSGKKTLGEVRQWEAKIV